MIERPGTWAEIEVGMTVLTRTELPVICTGRERGWTRFEDRNHHEYRMPPQPDDKVVTILEATEEEAESWARQMLGAHRVLDIETEKRVEKRALRWIVEPFPVKGQRNALNRARDHVDWDHGTYSGDAAAYGGFKNLVEITRAHEEMHEMGFMDRPHTHKEN